MVERLKDVMVNAGAAWVLWLLFGLSIVSIGIMIERGRLFLSRRDDIAALLADLHRLLAARDLEGARARLARSRSVEAAVALAGLEQWARGPRPAAEAMAAATGLERGRLERHLMFLGTLGNNAPFIGLLGTVIGVVGAFQALGSAPSVATATAAAAGLAPERVMSTIAEALVATAVGILVAIPAVAVFNYFQGLVAAVVANADTLGHVVLTHIPLGPESAPAPGENAVRPIVPALAAGESA
ncbi:MAG TPA: MotA/TolQ/ExbB proton channel family protein [Polyangiaceae bacterium]|jgi:biopolymer transport protein ExbB